MVLQNVVGWAAALPGRATGLLLADRQAERVPAVHATLINLHC